MRKNISRILIVQMVLFVWIISGCKKEEHKVNCHDIVNAHSGYEVWAGDSAFFALSTDSLYQNLFYSIDKYGYHFIDSGTTIKWFNTGSYKYYVIVAKYTACIDAIQFADSSYYSNVQGYTAYGGLTEYFLPPGVTQPRCYGAPDGVGGDFGYKDLCPPPLSPGITSTFPDGNGTNSTYNAFISDDATILSRGGGLKVIITTGCTNIAHP